MPSFGRLPGDAAEVELFDAGRVGGAEERSHVVQAANIVQQHRDRQRADAVVKRAGRGGLKGNTVHEDVKLIAFHMSMLSIVIPIHNEEHSILPLYDRLTAVLEQVQRPYEILFVDDASTDRSFELLANLVETDGHLKVIRLRRNFGQTAALSAGFHEAKGEVIIAMDGDLQHAPEDIPALLAKIDEGYDIASGWRKDRVDNAIMRKIPSRIANWLMAKASGVELRDFGTTFKAYRAEVLKDVNLYGELHRFIPALASFYGARVAEVPIRNTPRAAGRFALRHRPHVPRAVRHPHHQVPAEVLHAADAFLRLAGAGRHRSRAAASWSTSLVKKLMGYDIVIEHGPLMVAGGLLLLGGLMMFSTGLIGEMMMRTYFESQDRRIYAVREILTRKQRGVAGGK